MLALVLGTRPEITKMSPVIRAAEKRQIPFAIIHSNQHYSPEMDKVFFDDLELPQPTINLGIGSGSHAVQTGKMLIALEEAFDKIQPAAVLVQGDTNTVLAGALVASKRDIPVGHIEAGLRSFDRSMPEEINRIVTDHISTWLFPPTVNSAKTLAKEGIGEELIFTVGNTIVDAVLQNKEIAEERSQILETHKLTVDYAVLTLHRPSNVDDHVVLKRIMETIDAIARDKNLTIVFPIHPRTRAQLTAAKIVPSERILLIDPVGYFDFLKLQRHARIILTDSGGIQEEACILGIPCVTLRENTERPETVEVGANTLVGVGLTQKGILEATDKILAKKPATWANPFGDGSSSQQILEIVTR